ncbi:VapE domain-containing protein [Comamonas terrigena]|uniref:VapE domain-containing protein n=1 Tax=Comamonas terrigena TaxID=32013 RepID=UPI00235539AC|nr:VapE domain-containing protein [Comamonas terrigena]
MTQHREELPPIKFAELAAALNAMAERLLPLWLPGGAATPQGEYVCADLGGGKGTSCSVRMRGEKLGHWSDFATGEAGRDLLSLYAAIHDLTPGKAAVQVAREEGLESEAGLVKTAKGASVVPAPNPRPAPPPKAAPEREGWKTVMPVPVGVPAPTFKHYHRAPETLQHTAEYALGNELYGYVARFVTSDGGKDTLPYTFTQSERDGSQKWNWRQFDEPRPLYLPGGRLPEGRTVVLVEGEVKAELLQRVVDDAAPGVYCVASWPGGCKAWEKAGWDWLAGSTVLGWPDCDAKREKLTAKERESVKGDDEARKALESTKPLLPAKKQPGMQAQLNILALLRDSHGCTVSLLPIPEPGKVVDGWDCKDAIQVDGWTGEQVLAFFGQAQPLPAAGAAEPAAEPAAPEKKPRSPVGTKGQESGDGGSDDSDEPAGDDDTPAPKGTPWWLKPYWDRQKARWNISRKTVIAALENDDDLRGVVAFNELTNSVQCRKAWPWPHARPGEIKNSDGLLLGKYLTDCYSLPSVSRASLEEGVLTVAHTERFHPIREWLIDLKWDNESRIDKWLVHALGESPKTLNPALFEYLQLVGRYWLLGMVHRVMDPGCKFDYCPVLEGLGGLRKSTLVEVLCGKDYFSDTPFDMSRGKEAQEQVQGIWLYEIAELSAMSKADVNAVKAFISSKVDKYRPAYGTTVESYPRQCVLVGTTNDDQYLRDRTGNRRFWPIPVRHQINTEWVAKYRAQLLAEAFALYQQSVAYTPSQEQEKRLFKPMQDSRLIETAVESSLMELLTRDEHHQQAVSSGLHVAAKFVRLDQIVLALGSDIAKSSAALETQIRGWLKQQGWEHGKKQVDGKRSSGYFRPAVWPPVGVVVGLDKLEREGDAEAPPAPAEPAQAEPSAQLTPAAQFIQDQAADSAPF